MPLRSGDLAKRLLFSSVFISMAPAWWFCSAFLLRAIVINLDAFPSLGYVFHWKVVNHLKLLFFIGSGIFLASLTLFVSLWWYLSFPAIFFYPLSVIVLHILCSLPVCFGAFVISSRKPLNSKRTRDAGKCLLPPFQLVMGLDSTGNCTLNQSAHANYLRKSSGQDFYPEIQRLNEFRIHQNNISLFLAYLDMIR